jgi:hypothetical protein
MSRHRYRLDRLEHACRQQYSSTLDRLSVIERASRLCTLLARVCRRQGRSRVAARWTHSAAQFHAGRDDPRTQALVEQLLQTARRAVQQYRQASQ